MCDLAATGTNAAPLIVLAVAFVLAGALLFAKTRGRAAVILAVVLLLGGGATIAGSPTAAYAADCDNGTTVPPAVEQAVLSASVSVVSIDLTAPAGSFTITNVSAVPALDVDASFTVMVPGMVISGMTCTGSLAPGASCVVALMGDGASVPFTSTVRVAGSNTNVVLVAVEGALPSATISATPSPILFLGDGVESLVLTNTSSVVAVISGIAPPTNTAVAIDATACSAPLPPGGSCTIVVTFTSATTSGGTWDMVVTGNFATVTVQVFAAI